jgi:thymidylate synthase
VDYENIRQVETNQTIYENATVKENYIDQLELLIQGLKNNPNDRRHILTAWNVGELSKMALPPCHCFAQFFVQNGKLSCQLYQRSADVFLGVPFNITSYAIFTTMLAQVCGLGVGEFIWTGGDIHIYKNHVDQVKQQLEREPKQLPTIWVNPEINNINDFTMDDIKINDYDPHPTIKAEMAA